MSNDRVSRAVFGVSYETIIRRILRTFDRASAADIEAGARWYDEAGELAATLATKHDHSVETVAAVISALSPRTTWARNVAGTLELLATGELYPGIIRANYDRAMAVLNGVELNGPKTRNFAANIAGDRESVTVDVWAMRVADLDENLLGRKGAYDAVADAYRAAARRRGVDPATMQATTWIVARNGRAA